jgi:hypothetical protein
MREGVEDVPHEPLSGWLQIVRRIEPGPSLGYRFHRDEGCARRTLARVEKRLQVKGVNAEAWLSGPHPYADIRAYKGLTVCKCAGGSHGYAVGPDRRWGEVQAGSQGTGKRR